MHNANRLQLERIDTGGGVQRKRSVTNCKMPRIPAGHMRIMVNPRPFPRERGVAGETRLHAAIHWFTMKTFLPLYRLYNNQIQPCSENKIFAIHSNPSNK